MKILLVSGHGDGDPGAVGNGYKEADLVRELAKIIKNSLSQYATVDIADTSKNWYKHICKQGNYFNFKPYNYVLELHFNATTKETVSDGQTKGTEIYVTTSEKSTAVEAEILKGITDIGFRNRGVKSKDFALIRYIKKQGVSSALLEVCFISDIDDMKLYTSQKNKIADAIAKGIVKGFGLKKEGNEMTTEERQKFNALVEAVERLQAQVDELRSEDSKPVSSWFKNAFDKATAKGILDGSAPKGKVTRDMLAEVLNRLNLLDK